jgi:hypothetical protein
VSAMLRATVHYIPHEDPAINPDAEMFTIVQNPMNIDKPFRLPHSYKLCGNRTLQRSAWLQRDLSGLPTIISNHGVQFYPEQIRDTPEFKAARDNFRKMEKNCQWEECGDVEEFEDTMEREMRVEYHMRKWGTPRDLAEKRADDWEKRDRAVADEIAKQRAETQKEIDEKEKQRLENLREQEQREVERLRVMEAEKQKVREEKEKARKQQERLNILRRDPWAARENDEKWGKDQWEPVPQFGTDVFRSEELRYREGRIEDARRRGNWLDESRLTRNKFSNRFPNRFPF